MSEWLDTETKAILQPAPPAKLAPPDTVGFSIVLLSRTNDQARLRYALMKAGCSEAVSNVALAGRCPHVVATGLALDDARLALLELACCDSVAVFIRDEVVAANDQAYLSGLYSELSTSEEFERVGIEIRSVPCGEQGRGYLQQFLGMDARSLERVGFPLHRTVMRNKARIMCHWGRQIGADVRMTES